MAIDRERKNVQMDGVTVMCSSKKLERAISADCGTVHRVGFALDMHDMHPEAGIVRRNYLAIMYHPNPDKGYSTAVAVADVLYAKKKIDGVITFGTTIGYNDATKPMALIKHYQNANRDQIREIFNTCKCFLMPSISEGLNLTPIESTLCGCPTVLCDGAIDEIFFNNKNCLVVDKNNVGQMEAMVLTVLDSFESHSSKFMKRMRFVIKSYTWNTVIENILKLL
jgi:glycosyltransferase involved in cell wall biosynthesis